MAINFQASFPGIHCFSDASWVKGGRATFGIIVVKDDNIMRRTAGVFPGVTETSAIAEVLATMTLALSAVPDGAGGVSHTDLHGIASILRHVSIRRKKYTEAILALRDEIVRTGVTVEYTERNKRPAFYRQCHRMAKCQMRSGQLSDPGKRSGGAIPVVVWPATLTYRPFALEG